MYPTGALTPAHPSRRARCGSKRTFHTSNANDVNRRLVSFVATCLYRRMSRSGAIDIPPPQQPAREALPRQQH
eukprot:608058-Prorocentrum_minimum.AAC.6